MAKKKKVHITHWHTDTATVKTYCGIYVGQEHSVPTWSKEATCKICKRIAKILQRLWK